jgi:hypothetical protein
MKDVQPGDILRCAQGNSGIVRCVLKTVVDAEFVRLHNGLVISKWHPVWQYGWRFPCRLPHELVQVSEMYNLVMEEFGCKFPLVNGQVVATLGHNLSGPIIGHAFYGTQRVIDNLKTHPDWENGYIMISPDAIQRGKSLSEHEPNLVMALC